MNISPEIVYKSVRLKQVKNTDLLYLNEFNMIKTFKKDSMKNPWYKTKDGKDILQKILNKFDKDNVKIIRDPKTKILELEIMSKGNKYNFVFTGPFPKKGSTINIATNTTTIDEDINDENFDEIFSHVFGFLTKSKTIEEKKEEWYQTTDGKGILVEIIKNIKINKASDIKTVRDPKTKILELVFKYKDVTYKFIFSDNFLNKDSIITILKDEEKIYDMPIKSPTIKTIPYAITAIFKIIDAKSSEIKIEEKENTVIITQYAIDAIKYFSELSIAYKEELGGVCYGLWKNNTPIIVFVTGPGKYTPKSSKFDMDTDLQTQLGIIFNDTQYEEIGLWHSHHHGHNNLIEPSGGDQATMKRNIGNKKDQFKKFIMPLVTLNDLYKATIRYYLFTVDTIEQDKPFTTLTNIIVTDEYNKDIEIMKQKLKVYIDATPLYKDNLEIYPVIYGYKK